MAALGHDHRPAALCEKQEGEARGNRGILDPPGYELAAELILGVHEHPRPLAVPVMLADVSPGREPPHPLEAVEVVIEPGVAAGARVLSHAQPAAEPVEAPLE